VSEYSGGPGDNFNPEQREQAEVDALAYLDFNEARWRRLPDITDDDIAALRSHFESKTEAERVTDNKRLASVSDGDLAAELETFRAAGGNPSASPFNKPVHEVQADVGDDPDKAREALAFETSPLGKGRTTLVEHLEKVIADDEEAKAAAKTPQTQTGAEGK
jgi:hypothetical protein